MHLWVQQSAEAFKFLQYVISIVLGFFGDTLYIAIHTYILCKSITRRSKRVEVLSVMFNVVYIQEHNEFNPGVEYAPCPMRPAIT